MYRSPKYRLSLTWTLQTVPPTAMDALRCLLVFTWVAKWLLCFPFFFTIGKHTMAYRRLRVCLDACLGWVGVSMQDKITMLLFNRPNAQVQQLTSVIVVFFFFSLWIYYFFLGKNWSISISTVSAMLTWETEGTDTLINLLISEEDATREGV